MKRRTYFRHSEASDDMIIMGMDERGTMTQSRASVKVAKAIKKDLGKTISPKAVLCRYHAIRSSFKSKDNFDGYLDHIEDWGNLRQRMARHMMDPKVDLNITVKGKEIHIVFK